jgi:hypothetical protein
MEYHSAGGAPEVCIVNKMYAKYKMGSANVSEERGGVSGVGRKWQYRVTKQFQSHFAIINDGMNLTYLVKLNLHRVDLLCGRAARASDGRLQRGRLA